MLTCTCESVTNESYPFRAHIELSVMGYNSVPRKFDIVVLSGQLSVMILFCCFIHYIVIRILRRSTLDAPCSCPACCEKHAVQAAESSFELAEKNRVHRFDSLKTAFEESDIRDSRATEGCGYESSESGYSSAVEDLDDQDVENDADGKNRELWEDLQRERETVAALYSELEEERNCSASAACEAMAMISRLHEEKAAVQMEARQFKRMVVEKAAYDQEAIEAVNELLLRREQEKVALEEEIRACKEKLDAIASEERSQSRRRKAKVDEVNRAPLPKSQSLTWAHRNENIDKASRGGRDEQCKYVDKFSTTSSNLLTALVQDGRDEQRLSNDIQKQPGESSEEVDGGEPEIFKSIDAAAKAGRYEQPYHVEEAIITANGQLYNATPVQNGARGMDIQAAGGRPAKNGSSRKVDEVVEGGKLKPEFPGFVSLKRRWGSQEITLKTLEQTKEERRVEDKKKGSVLEYVKKLELQQQQGVSLPVQMPSVAKLAP